MNVLARSGLYQRSPEAAPEGASVLTLIEPPPPPPVILIVAIPETGAVIVETPAPLKSRNVAPYPTIAPAVLMPTPL